MITGSNISSLNVKIGVDSKAAVDGLKQLHIEMEQLKKDGEDVEQLDGKLSDLQSLVVAGAAASAVKFLADQMSQFVKDAIAYESAMAGVAKTTDLSGSELEDYGKALMDMSRYMPMTTNELASISEMAGQLGISGSRNLLNFTQTMAKLGTATNMTAEQAATMLAQFANITGMGADEYDRLASTIVALGNNFATTESKITDMAQGMAAAATNAGIAESDILALAAAASSIGMEAQAGATSWSKLIQEMQTAVETGEDLDKWADASGMTATEFKYQWEKNATGAIVAFVNGLKKHNDEGRSMLSILNDLGITEVRQSKLVQSLANAGDLLNNALATGNAAWSENTALNKEAATRFQTTESKIQMLQNSMNNTSITIGRKMTPALNVILDVLNDASEAFGKFIEENDWVVPAIIGTATGLGVLAAAMGIASIGASSLASAFQTLAASIMACPVAWIIAGIAAATVAMTMWSESVLEANETMRSYSDQAEQMAETSEDFGNSINDVVAANEKQSQFLEGYLKIVDELATKTNRSKEENWRLEYAIEQLNKSCPELALTVESLANGLTEEARAAIKAKDAQSKYNAILDKQNEIQGEVINAEVTLKAAEQELTRQKAGLTDQQLKLADAYLKGEKAAGDLNNEWAQAVAETVYLDDETKEYVNSLREYEEIQASCNEVTQNAEDAQKALDEILGEITDEYDLTGDAVNEFQIDTENLTEAERQQAEAVAMFSQEQIAAIEQLSAEHETAKETALNNIQKQIDGWNELKADTSVSIKDMISGYKSQSDYMKNYTDNMKSLIDRNIDGLEDYVKAIDDGSTEAAGAFEAMKNASDDELKELVSSYQEREGTLGRYTENVADMQTDYDERMQDIINSTKTMVSEFDRYDEAFGAASNTVWAVVDAADNLVDTVAGRYKYLMKTAIQQLQGEVQVKLSTKTGSNSARIWSTGTMGYTGQYDSGGIIKQPQVALVAERRPEFVGAAEDLETFINQSVNQAFNLSLPTLPEVKNGSSNITVNVPISVSKELSESEINRKAKQISQVVSKEFAMATGGRL